MAKLHPASLGGGERKIAIGLPNLPCGEQGLLMKDGSLGSHETLPTAPSPHHRHRGQS